MAHLIPDVFDCHVLRILVVAVCRIGNVCCLPEPAHQPFSFNSLGLSAPEEACSRNVRALGTLSILGMKVFFFFFFFFFKIITTGSISLLVACPLGYHELSVSVVMLVLW